MALDNPANSLSEARLRHMKLVATGLLVLMLMVFLATSYYLAAYPWLGYIRAFSEAAMIGALADWFAVTALFKHPLGIPIPHTAIIPKRKDEIGISLARFIDNNFLTSAAIGPRLQEFDFATSIGRWMRKPENANRLSSDIRTLLNWLLGSLDNRTLRDFVKRNFEAQTSKFEAAPLIGTVLSMLTKQNLHQDVVDALIEFLREKLHDNKDLLRGKIEKESPWWLPGFIDNKIYERLINHLDEVLSRISAEGDHAVREEFDHVVEALIDQFKHDPETIARGEQIKQDLLKHPAVGQYINGVGKQVRAYLEHQVSKDDSELNQHLQNALVRFGNVLLDDEAMRTQINEWLANAIVHVVEKDSQNISSVVSDTIRNWDPQVTSQRIELAIGRDLQFIRINGTIVGGLVGLTIYSLVNLTS